MVRGAVQRDREEILFRSLASHARQCACFGVAQLTALHCSRNSRQLLQRMRDAHLLASRANSDPAFPIQPMRARLRRAVRPTLSSIEFGDEHQETMIGRIQMAGELRDLVLESLHRANRLCSLGISEVRAGCGSLNSLSSGVCGGDVHEISSPVRMSSILLHLLLWRH